MRGGAQAHLMRTSDGHFYVVKFQNNPQHLRVLANELLATRIAERIGLPVPRTEVVEVGDWLVEHTPDLSIQLAGQNLACRPGLQFGSRYVVDPLDGQVLDYLPDLLLPRVRNLGDFAGVLALDKWTCNANGRQAAFWRKSRERRYTATFIDQGYCFNAGEWSFPDSPLRGVLRAQRSLRRRDRVGVVRALAVAHRDAGRERDVDVRGSGAAGVVRGRMGSAGEAFGDAAEAADTGAGADRGFPEIVAAAVPELEGQLRIATETQRHRGGRKQ